jgi:SAM-dependent methyltransferase
MLDAAAAAPRPDSWAAGVAYEPYMGRWSRPVASKFLDWLSLPAGARWLDIGCGTGALTQTILTRAEPAEVTGIDPSEQYVAYARRQVSDRRAGFRAGDAQALPVPDASRDAVVSGLVLNFVADPKLAVAEMMRVLRPGGTAAAYVWDYAGNMQLIRHFWNAAVALDPAAQVLDEAARFPLCRPAQLHALFGDGGFVETDCRAIDVPTVFTDFDDLWLPYLGGQGPAPTYCGTLSEERRTTLRERLRAALPIAPDGSIGLTARAFAVRGVRER